MCSLNRFLLKKEKSNSPECNRRSWARHLWRKTTVAERWKPATFPDTSLLQHSSTAETNWSLRWSDVALNFHIWSHTIHQSTTYQGHPFLIRINEIMLSRVLPSVDQMRPITKCRPLGHWHSMINANVMNHLSKQQRSIGGGNATKTPLREESQPIFVWRNGRSIIYYH